MLSIRKVNISSFLSIKDLKKEYIHSVDCDGRYNENCKQCRRVMEYMEMKDEKADIKVYKIMASYGKCFFDIGTNLYENDEDIVSYEISIDGKNQIDEANKDYQTQYLLEKKKDNLITEMCRLSNKNVDMITDIVVTSDRAIKKMMLDDARIYFEPTEESMKDGKYVYRVRDFTTDSPLVVASAMYSNLFLKIFCFDSEGGSGNDDVNLKINYTAHIMTNKMRKYIMTECGQILVKTDNGGIYKTSDGVLAKVNIV